MQIPYFRPLPIDYEKIEPRIKGVVDSRVYTKGCYRDELEDSLADYLRVNYVVATSSGTSALFIAMRILRQMYGDERISIPAFTWGSVKAAARMAGYKIVWNDIDEKTWLPHDIDNNTGAVLGHDTFGSLDDNEYPENCIIDATHSVGINDRWAWDRGTGCCGSMAGTKMITAAGEGGFITSNNQYFARKCGELRDMCARITEIQCVFALEYLSHLDEVVNTKRDIAEYYRKHLPEYQFQLYKKSTHSKVCFLCDNSEELIARASKAGVELRKYYKPLAHLPNSDYVYDHIVCLPSWSGVDFERVATAIR